MLSRWILSTNETTKNLNKIKGTRENHGINDNIDEVMQTYLFLDVFRLYLCDTHDNTGHLSRARGGARGAFYRTGSVE